VQRATCNVQRATGLQIEELGAPGRRRRKRKRRSHTTRVTPRAQSHAACRTPQLQLMSSRWVFCVSVFYKPPMADGGVLNIAPDTRSGLCAAARAVAAGAARGGGGGGAAAALSGVILGSTDHCARFVSRAGWFPSSSWPSAVRKLPRRRSC
jgi:hypothetical protein